MTSPNRPRAFRIPSADPAGSEVPPVLLRRETDVGHSARSVDRTIALTIDTLSFLADQLGLDLDVLGANA